MSRQTEYLLADGSPRYGIRTDDAPAPAVSKPVTGKLPAEAAAGLHRQQLAMAAALRTVRFRSEDAEELVAKLRSEHPAEHVEALKAAVDHLGTPRKWARASLYRFTEQVTDSLMDSPAGVSRFLIPAVAAVLFLLGIPALAIGLPLAGYELSLTLPVLALYFFVGARFVGSMMAKARYPERFKLNRYLAEDLYLDVVDATLVRILQDKGTEIDPVTERMANRGWRDIQAVAAKVEEIYSL
ncbi:hypothetical protein [Crystallibacter degradans]|uniref:hypothetical protein n=1 Tax=Crystallibacter degradans TaxID=2726743 RepID=UPI001475089F|nr:hypothetical protein [Arthrobacter sp. SF27]NMR31972.1 hypothetical protein [Arthrobacter sp. SF27]